MTTTAAALSASWVRLTSHSDNPNSAAISAAFPVQVQERTLAGVVRDLDVDPAHVPDPAAEGLDGGLLGGDARRQAQHVPGTQGGFLRREEARIEALPEAVAGAFHAGDVDEVQADAEHRSGQLSAISGQ